MALPWFRRLNQHFFTSVWKKRPILLAATCVFTVTFVLFQYNLVTKETESAPGSPREHVYGAGSQEESGPSFRSPPPKGNLSTHEQRIPPAIFGTLWSDLQSVDHKHNNELGNITGKVKSRYGDEEADQGNVTGFLSGKKERHGIFDQYNPLMAIPVMESSSVPRILLVTYFRSGSSFLGDLLQQNFRTFYTFEPLHFMESGSGNRIQNESFEAASHLIQSILQCNFPQLTSYIKWALKPENRFLFKWNTFLWSTCRFRPSFCFNPAFIKETCIRASTQVMKLTRIHMSQVVAMMEQIKDEQLKNSIKVVYLVRDPRGIYNSRKNMTWCANTSCSNIETLCSEISSDLSQFEDMKASQPWQYYLLRYEDLSLNPVEEAVKLFHHLKIPFSSPVHRYLLTHTTVKEKKKSKKLKTASSKWPSDGNPYSTRRDSKHIAFEWRNKLSVEEVRQLESSCSSVFKKLGYKSLTSSDTETITERSLLDQLPAWSTTETGHN